MHHYSFGFARHSRSSNEMFAGFALLAALASTLASKKIGQIIYVFLCIFMYQFGFNVACHSRSGSKMFAPIALFAVLMGTVTPKKKNVIELLKFDYTNIKNFCIFIKKYWRGRSLFPKLLQDVRAVHFVRGAAEYAAV